MTVLNYGRNITGLFRSLFTGRPLNTAVEQEPVLFKTVGTAGVVTLNRPKLLNVFNYQMCRQLLQQLQGWEQTRSRVIIKGAGNAFSAGGDLKLLSKLEPDPMKYAHLFSNIFYLLSQYRIPYIALMDGITFGSGFALALHGRYRIATERTVVAAPETRIGWITDASATYLLPRLDNHLGIYMGLTGKRLKGKDVVAAGLATHFVPSARLKELEVDLCCCSTEDIGDRLNVYSAPPGEFSRAPIIKDMDYCFSAATVEEIFERILKVDNSWSKETVEMLACVCPTMLKVSLRALQYGKFSDMKQCLRTEIRMVYRAMGSYNAQEGVRAFLIDKDHQPKWQPATVAEVSTAAVDSYFDPLPVEEEASFFDEQTSICGPRNL